MIMHAPISALLLGASLVAAASSTKKCKAQSEVINFDNVPAIVAIPTDSIPNPYMGLKFTSFDAIKVLKTGLLPGPPPHSGDTYIGAAIQTELSGLPRISIASGVKSFDLTSFYYACVADASNGAVGISLPCEIQVTGFSGDENSGNVKEVCNDRFVYNPPSPEGINSMAHGSVKGCKDITYAEITWTLTNGEQALTVASAILIDDVAVNLKKC